MSIENILRAAEQKYIDNVWSTIDIETTDKLVKVIQLTNDPLASVPEIFMVTQELPHVAEALLIYQLYNIL